MIRRANFPPRGGSGGSGLDQQQRELLRTATWLIERGGRVVRLWPSGKPHKGTKADTGGTTDVHVVQWWLDSGTRALGGIPPADMLVIDVDTHDPKRTGFDSLKALEDRHGKLPATATARTRSDGAHLLFKLPPGAPPMPGRIGAFPGVDVVRARGAAAGSPWYFVLVGSVTTKGKPYAWHRARDDQQIATAPSWLIDACRPVSRQHVRYVSTHPKSRSTRPGPPQARRRIEPGERNDRLFRDVACSLRRRGAAHDGVLAELRRQNGLDCSPSLPDDELVRIADSACRYAPGSTSAELAGVQWWIGSQRWRGKQRAVVHAMLEITAKSGKVEFHAGVRDVSEIAGAGIATVMRTLRLLRQRTALRLVRTAKRGDAHVYRWSEHVVSRSGAPRSDQSGTLNHPASCLEGKSRQGMKEEWPDLIRTAKPENERRAENDLLHASKLPLSALLVLYALERAAIPVSRGVLAARTALSAPTVSRCLRRLADVGLAAGHRGRRWQRGDADLATVAAYLGATGAAERRRRRHQAERAAWGSGRTQRATKRPREKRVIAPTMTSTLTPAMPSTMITRPKATITTPTTPEPQNRPPDSDQGARNGPDAYQDQNRKHGFGWVGLCLIDADVVADKARLTERHKRAATMGLLTGVDRL